MALIELFEIRNQIWIPSAVLLHIGLKNLNLAMRVELKAIYNK